MESNGPVVAVLSSDNELCNVVDLHQSSFAYVLIGQLGRNFLKYYYRKIWNSKFGVILVYKEGNKVIGFVAGMIHSQDFYNVMFYIRALWGVLTNLFWEPSIVINLFRYLGKVLTFKNDMFHSELLSIAVLEGYERKGIGKALTHAFDEYLRQKGIQAYKVFTDLDFSKGYLLYEKLSFELYKEKNLFGSTHRMYIKKLS